MQLDTTGRPSVTCTQQNAGPALKATLERTLKKDTETQTSNPYISSNNSILKKNPTAELGIEPGTSVSNDVNTEPSGRPSLIHI